MIINWFFKSLIDFSFIKLMSYLYPKIVAEYWSLPYIAWGRKKQSKTRNNILSFFSTTSFYYSQTWAVINNSRRGPLKNRCRIEKTYKQQYDRD